MPIYTLVLNLQEGSECNITNNVQHLDKGPRTSAFDASYQCRDDCNPTVTFTVILKSIVSCTVINVKIGRDLRRESDLT